jgi:hypothetical protein
MEDYKDPQIVKVVSLLKGTTFFFSHNKTRNKVCIVILETF